MKNRIIIDGIHDIEEKRLLANLPSEYPMNLSTLIEMELRATLNEMVVYLEDDSTGVQKSHNVYLITDYSEAGIRAGIKAARIADHRLVFILTNSRSLSRKQTEELIRDIAFTLKKIALDEGLILRIGSRSDSTLRGHFPLESIVLMNTLESYPGKYDGIIVTHAFLTKMSRITVNGIHLLRVKKENGSFWYRPVHKTKFAEDKRFGYPTSNMADYVEYKFTSSELGDVKAGDVLHIDIDTIRRGGPDEVLKQLLKADNGRVITVDVVTHGDLQVFILGLLRAEKKGKLFIYRSAASFPPTRVNMMDIPVLNRENIFRTQTLSGNILCLWGSIVGLSNIQLEATLNQISDIIPLPFDVKKVLKSDKDRLNLINLTVRKTEEVFKRGKHVIIYTIPRTEYPPEVISDETRATNQQQINSSLQKVYNQISIRPSIVIFKGGATSSYGLFNLGVSRVYVLGQISPGIPIVKILCQDKERFSREEMLMILGPGNVGTRTTYVDIIKKLRGKYV